MNYEESQRPPRAPAALSQDANHLVERLAELLLGQDATPPRTPLAPIVGSYVENMEAEGKSIRYVNDVRGSLAAALAEIGVSTVEAIDARVLLSWRVAMLGGDVTHRTANKKVEALVRCLSWASRYGLVSRYQVPSLDRLDEKERHKAKRRRPLDEQEIQRYVAASLIMDARGAEASRHYVEQTTFPLMLMESGPRFTEAAAPDWKHYTPSLRTLVLVAGTTKGGRRREISLSPTVSFRLDQLHLVHLARYGATADLPIFRGQRGRGRLRHQAALNRHYEVLKAAGIPRFDNEGRCVDLHALRYSAAVRLINTAGLDLSQVSELLGHRNVRLTQAIYIQHGASRIGAKLEGLPTYPGATDRNPSTQNSENPASLPQGPPSAPLPQRICNPVPYHLATPPPGSEDPATEDSDE